MPPISDKSTTISLHIQEMATEINSKLEDLAGEPIAFALVVGNHHDTIVQYVSNTSRKETLILTEAMLAKLKSGDPQVPAHENPQFKGANDGDELSEVPQQHLSKDE